MRKLILSAVTALSVVAGAAAAQAAPLAIAGVDHPGDAVLSKAQYVYRGHDWCWYDRAWRGAGFYWCGYASRRGLGWGGPVGWRGWYSGGRYWRDGVWIGPRGYANREWGGWRGPRDWHGDRRGGRHGDRHGHRR
jgi:hypothetical protein